MAKTRVHAEVETELPSTARQNPVEEPLADAGKPACRDPFELFEEWSGAEDEAAYADLPIAK